MRVGIGLKYNAYTPEAYAYASYLNKNGVDVQLEHESLLCLNNDLNVYFMGFRPSVIYKKNTAIEIHEYQSLSTEPFPKIKDFLKVNINKKPKGRIFLNSTVKERLRFNDDIPYIYRDMGVDKAFYQSSKANKEFDIVYSGSIRGRQGLIPQLYRLASLGFKLLIIGDVEVSIIKLFSKFGKNVIFTGRVSREQLPDLYKICRAGLNFTPDIYPFNIQTSTKTLEYLASGLRVITNKYYWSEFFFLGQESHCVFLDEIDVFFEINNINTRFVNIEDYEWEHILYKSNFIGFINGVSR
ncbi:glycosyltransferase family protein [Vibrio cholerae]|uniref:glycosyltransferase n=1 Tax=Vibrio cholerae TaxID=666 RepID=UPI0011D553C2|nr:glycosyltransferase [Vibrio cholerae]EGR1137019.1 glycosyltransferase [Vibrio cholerae]MEB5520064.1 glycosyltransferase [Vibrio cholerae]TXZ00558.1 glycosyltransferase family 4 protein [Vibrio cholerae]BCN17507.1 putative glycosyltransferase [Vibrio cholerae]BCN21238.1 putative glycosyltransferase [Vibrio cholerae]